MLQTQQFVHPSFAFHCSKLAKCYLIKFKHFLTIYVHLTLLIARNAACDERLKHALCHK